MGRWIKCKNCGHEYHNDLKECPHCYKKTPLTLKRFAVYGVIAILISAFVIGIVLLVTSDDIFKDDSVISSQIASSDKDDISSSDLPNSSDKVTTEPEDDIARDEEASSYDQSSSSSSSSSSVVVNSQSVSSDRTSSGDIEYVEFTLPEQLDTEKVIKSLSSTYFPLSIYSLDSSFRASEYFQSYTRELEKDHLYLRMTGKLPRCVIYQYEVRGQVEDINAVKKKCEKYFSENSEYYKAQYDTIKKYVKDIESLEVRFFFLNHNEYVTSQEIK